MLPYAYSKIAGAEEGKITRQANDQSFQIDKDRRDTELKFTELWNQTEIEKENQMQGIRDYYGSAIRNVQAAIASAPLDKAKDLAALSQSLLSEALANLRQLQTEDRQRKETVKNWATERMTQLNNLKIELSGSANFEPEDILWSELPLLGDVSKNTASSADSFYNPMLIAQQKREDYLS